MGIYWSVPPLPSRDPTLLSSLCILVSTLSNDSIFSRRRVERSDPVVRHNAFTREEELWVQNFGHSHLVSAVSP